MAAQDHDRDLAIASLRERGAHRFDPVRFRYIEALARRAADHRGDTRRTLDRILAKVLAEYGEQFEKARSEAGPVLTRAAEAFPHAAEDFHRLHARGDFKGLRRLVARLEGQGRRGPLADLVRHIDLQASEHGDARSEDAGVVPVGPPGELKSLKRFRSIWSRLSVDRQLTRSLAKLPEKPGPLNSHLLVLRSLQSMQDVSPEYLERFMAYVDALLWLDQASGASAPVPTDVVCRESDKKRKSGRGKTR